MPPLDTAPVINIIASNEEQVTASLAPDIAKLLVNVSIEQLKPLLEKLAAYNKNKDHKRSQGTGDSTKTLRRIRDNE